MKHFIKLIILMTVLNMSVFAADTIQKQLKLEVGGETIVTIPELNGISNAGDIVEDIILNDGESVMLRGKNWGDTQLTVWDKNGKRWIYDIQVAMPKFVRELQSFLEEIEGVDVNFLGRNIIVEGQLLRKSDAPKLDGIMNNFPEVKNMVTKTIPSETDILIEAVKAELYNSNIKCNFLGDGLMFEGQVYSQKELEKAKSTAKKYFNSSYPALEQLKPLIKLKCDFLSLFPKKEGAQGKSLELKNFVSTSLKSKKIRTYTFINSNNHDQNLETVVNIPGATPIEQKIIEVKSEDTTTYSSENEGMKFTLEFKPRVFSPKWSDLRINVLFEVNGQKVFWKTQRAVLKNNQGIAISGIIEALAAHDSTLVEKAKLNPLFASVAGNSEKSMLILITPEWENL